MPASMADYQKIADKITAKTQEAADYGGASLTLKDQVMNAVTADRATRGVTQMAQDFGNTLGQLQTDPIGIRERAADMVNPMDVDYLTSRARGINLNTMGTLSKQQELNTRSLEDIIQAGANQLSAKGKTLEGEANVEREKAQAMLNELNYELQLRKQQFDEYAKQQELELAWSKLTGGGGGSGGNSYGGGAKDAGFGDSLQGFSDAELDAARSILSGAATLTSFPTKDNFRGRVASALTAMTSNPGATEKLFGISPFSTMEGAAQEAAYKLKMIQTAQAMINEGGQGTGLLEQWVTKAKANQAGGSAADFLNVMAKLRSEEMFSIGGKALTNQERTEIEPYVPGMKKNEGRNVKDLDAMYKKANQAYVKKVLEEAKDRGIPMTYDQAQNLVNRNLGGSGSVGMDKYWK